MAGGITQSPFYFAGFAIYITLDHYMSFVLSQFSATL